MCAYCEDGKWTDAEDTSEEPNFSIGNTADPNQADRVIHTFV